MPDCMLAYVPVLLALVLSGGSPSSRAEDPQPQDPPTRQSPARSPQQLLRSLVGRWKGTCKTWTAGKLIDESAVEGEFRPLLGGKLVRHTYEGSMREKPRSGEETFVYNAAEKRFEVAWFDEFHMNYAILFSTGKPTERGFSVLGSYRMAPGQKPWGWRTDYEFNGADRLTIRAFNVTPDGRDEPAVELVYERMPTERR